MKIVRSLVVIALMSSFLVTGLDSEDKGSSDIVSSARAADQRPDSAASDDKQDNAQLSHKSLPGLVSSDASSHSQHLQKLKENVIFETDILEEAADLGETGMAASESSPEQSVITGESQNVAPSTSRDQISSDESSERDTDLSQLSKKDREKLLNNLEATFLNIVGLKSRPRPSGDVTIPQYMLDLYRQHLQSNQGRKAPSKYRKGLHNSNTIRSFFHTEEADKHPENVVRLNFNVTSIPGHEVLQAAELRLYRMASNHSNQQHVVSSAQSLSDQEKDKLLDELLKERHRIDVYQIIKPASSATGRSPLTRLIDTGVVDPTVSRWESFDITPALESWRTDENHGLEVRFSKVSGEPSPLRHVRLKRSTKPIREEGLSPDEEGQDWEGEKPLLVAYSRDRALKSDEQGNKKRQQKRSADKKRNRKKRDKKERKRRRKDRPRKNRDYKKHCRRRELYVDFRDVGWTDWIVAPPGYDAFYCYGECPFHLADHFNTTNHAVVQQFVHSVTPEAAPMPCCVPTELGQVALLYIDEENKVVLKNYKEMVVMACGCR